MDKDIVADPEATIIGKEGKKSNLIVYDHAGPDKADVEINEEKVKKGDSDEIIYVLYSTWINLIKKKIKSALRLDIIKCV